MSTNRKFSSMGSFSLNQGNLQLGEQFCNTTSCVNYMPNRKI